jgi:hypothetical protein
MLYPEIKEPTASMNWRYRRKGKGNKVSEADCFLMLNKYLPHNALNKKVLILQWTLKHTMGEGYVQKIHENTKR